MNTSEFRAKAREIVDSLEHNQAVAFEYALSMKSQPLQEALARTVLLIGDEPVTLVDGIVKDDEDEDDVEGWLVVMTADRLVRAVYGSEAVIVEAVSLTSVRSVRVDSVWAMSKDEASWPGSARVVLVLDRDVAGAHEIVIPSSTAAEKHLAGALAALSQRMPIA